MDWSSFRLSTRLQLSPIVTEKIYTLIAEIDAIKNTFRLTDKLLPQTIDRLTQSVIVTSTGASNRIEGNRLSDDEVEALYKSMHIKSFKTRDEQEVAGYLDMLEHVFSHHDAIPIKESSILQLHQDMLTYSETTEAIINLAQTALKRKIKAEKLSVSFLILRRHILRRRKCKSLSTGISGL